MNNDITPGHIDDREQQVPEPAGNSVKREPPYYSIILISCLVVVWLCQVLIDGPESFVFGGNRSALLTGALRPAIASGQYWRILTSGAVHSGAIHLLFNCYALYVLGRLIEWLSNRAHLAIVFLLAVIGGSLLSYWLSPALNSVGASGGIVGFLGYLAVYGYKRRKVLTSSFLKNMLFNIGFMALYGFALRDVIDNFGHLGGLLTGAAYGLFQITGDVYEDPRVTGKLTVNLGRVALGIFIATCVFTILILLGLIPVRLPYITIPG